MIVKICGNVEMLYSNWKIPVQCQLMIEADAN